MSDNTSSYKKKGKVIDIQALFQEYKSYWWLFAASVVGCMALALVYSAFKLPTYSVKANVLVAEEDETTSSMSKILAGNLFGNSSSVDDEQIIMSSHTVLMQTVKGLGLNQTYVLRKSFFDRSALYNDEPVKVSYPAELNDTISNGIVFKIWVSEDGKTKVEGKCKKKEFISEENRTLPFTLNTKFGEFTFTATEFFPKGEAFRETMSIVSYAAATENLERNVDIFIPNKKANFITLETLDPNVARAEATLNTIVANYNKKGVMDQQAKGYKTSEFINQRLNLLSEELDVAEGNIESYKKANNITDVQAEARYLMGRKGALENQLIAAETENEVLRLTRDFIADPANKYQLIPLSGMDYDGKTSSVTGAINAYNGLILNRMKIENNAKSNNASLKVLNEQIDAMRANINVSLDKAIENSNVALGELREQSRQSLSRLGNIPTQEREYYNIKRQQSVKEQLYLYLLQQREQTAMSLANSMPRGIVVDEAYSLLKPVSMSRMRMLMIAFVMGLLLPVAFLAVKSKLRNKFATREEVENYVDVPVLGEVCLSKRPGALVVKGSSSIAELFRLIRSRLQFVMTGNNDKIVLVTSTMAGEGKSFVSINLAASLALLGKKVLLVGMDIRKPQLAKYLDIKVEPGLTQYLSSNAYTIANIIQHNVEVEGLDVIVAGPIPPNPSELLASDKVDTMFDELRAEYDYIVIDSAPVGMVSDTFVLDCVADAAVYVCRANYTTLRDLDFINTVYKEKQLKKMALVVNGTASKKGYGYGYGKIDD